MSTIQRPTDCPSNDVILAFAKGEISDTWAQLIADHLGECSDCALKAHRVLATGSSWESSRGVADSSHLGLCLHDIVENAKSIPAQAAAHDALRGRRRMPRRLGRYDIKRLIGVGAFGRVYLAHDRGLDRQVAIKMPFRRKRAHDQLGQIMREARSAAKLRHPGIVSVFDVGRTRDQRVFGVFEYVDGETLDQVLCQSSFSPDRAVEITIAIAEALDYAHRNGVIHRDLKPSNIIMDSTGTPRIADFGLALRGNDVARREFVGTPNYMSPEQLRGETHNLDGATDVWSLGVVLYRMLTKRRPFAAATREDLYEKILTSRPRPLRDHDPEIPAELERICLRCLEKSRHHRYPHARQLIEDLQAYREHAPAERRLEQMSVACKGLRPFGERDAATFLPLLPGPADRFGLPDSLQFWRRCFDVDAVAGAPPLSALFGPTGCGKTSFVRAGLLPNLPTNMTPIVVESSQIETELELARALRTQFPELPPTGIVENFMQLRTRILPHRGERILIVLDQFEQWLHGHLRNTPLVDALRQCDGEHIMCLLVVRSEFWTAASMLFEELEVRLAEHQNYASLGMFAPDHAMLVLTAFGRGCGQLPAYPQELSRAQRKFLGLAVDAMLEDGVVAPVRLSAFAEIMRDRSWQSKTIRHLSGPAGVDFEFLKRCMAELCQATRFGDHRRAAQDVLWSLLPEDGQPLSSARKSASELAQIAAYRDRGGYFDELISILDQRLKLITPEDPEVNDPEEAVSAIPHEPSKERIGTPADAHKAAHRAGQGTEPGFSRLKKHGDENRCYRLTNAYLVPVLRDFLTLERRATLEGRMRMRLRELGRAWSLSGDKRHLPSMFETLAMTCWTRRSNWKAVEREMMHIAWWRAAKRAGAVVLLTLLILVPLVFTYRSLSRRPLVQQLLVADLTQVPALVQQIADQGPRIAPLIDAEWQRLDASVSDPELKPRRVRLAMATVDRFPARAPEILDAVRVVPENEITILAASFIGNPQGILDQLWRELLEAESIESNTASESLLRVASTLATADPEGRGWSDAGETTAAALMHARPYELHDWLVNLMPVRQELVPSLVDALGDSESKSASQRENLVEAAVWFAGDQPEQLLNIAQLVSKENFHLVRQALRPHETWVRSVLPERFEALIRDANKPVHVARPDIGAPLEAWLAKCQGLHTTKGALAMSIPFGELEDGLMHMYAAGYRPNSVRPYWFRSQLFATVCWNRSRRRYHWQADMTADELQRQHDLLKRESLELWDMADYQVDGQVRFVGLWLQSPTSEPLDTVLRLEQDGKEDRRGLYQLRTDGYSLHRYLSRIDEQGIRRYSSLWKPSVTSGRDDRSYSAYFGGIDFATTAQAITDCRILVLDPTRPQLFDLFETAAAGVQMLPNEQPVDRIITEAFAKYQTGQLDEALREINIAMGNSPQNLELIYLRGKLFVALGDVQGVRHTASLIALAGRLPYHAAYFRLRAYLLEGNSTAARRCLAELAQAYVRREQRDSPRLRYAYSSALTALAAALRETDPTASADFRGQAIQVFAEAHDVSWTHAGAVFREFDVLRTDERFLQLIAEAGWDGLISLSYIADPSVTSRWLPFMPVAEHDAESEQLAREGWTPQCTTVAYAPARRQLLAGSVWNRHAPSTKNVVTVSRPQANLALLLAAMGNEAYVTKVLDGEFGQELASHLMARAATADVNPELLLRVLADATQVPRRYQQVLCALSRYPLPRIPEPSRAELLARLNRLAVDEPNAGLRSAAIACLRNWAGRDAHPLLDFDPASLPPQNPIVEDRIRDWYRNAAGQTMIVVAPPETFAMGSSASDSERWSNEWTQNRYLNSRYALSATEVTARQYRRFLDDPKVKDFYASQAQRPQPRDYPAESPQCGIFYHDAARFCQWLSEIEGIPEEQWCYPGIWSPDYQIPCNLTYQTGYRLPTEAEWEYACRGGGAGARYYGNDAELLSEFAWFAGNSTNQTHPVAQKIPNEFGFFDMLGNVNEWCYEPYVERVYSHQPDGFFAFLAAACHAPDMRTVRGGSAREDARTARCAYRASLPISGTSRNVGFRVARTISP